MDATPSSATSSDATSSSAESVIPWTDQFGQREDIVEHLEAASLRILECHRDVNNPEAQATIRSLCSPKVQFVIHGVYATPAKIATCVDDYIGSLLWSSTLVGKWNLIIISTASSIDDDGWHAVVWVTYRGDWPDGNAPYKVEHVIMMCWRIDKGGRRWVLAKVNAMFGSNMGWCDSLR
jgi:hypothetical protein